MDFPFPVDVFDFLIGKNNILPDYELKNYELIIRYGK
jgi:hypothetical protein